MLNVAIPPQIADLGLSAGQTQWAVDAYSLVFAGLLLTAWSLSDRFGRKKGPRHGHRRAGHRQASIALRGDPAAGPRHTVARPIRASNAFA